MKRTLLLAVLAFVPACSGPTATMTPLAPLPKRAPTSPSAVVITPTGEKPPCETIVVGHVTGVGGGSRTGGADALATAEIRAKVAEHGLDGVVDYSCAKPGTWGADTGTCAGNAYYCKR